MYLKHLEISGFKSFAAKSTLDFLPACSLKDGKKCGVTAIVGPNGSGKSNIADAVRWVMGEQSMKNLRGKKSEDIIFAGSGKKARLGSAHVSLHFDNSDKRIPLEFGEVSISRKIFRSGESEYLINGSRVRLQDVIDLLAKAGIGRESYSIINQGMADAALNATPLERRTIIEDAAGVKHYQIKKDRSLRKLELTKENLEKVKGIVEEIKPHLRTLKRQAEKAAQGADIMNELKDKQRKLFTYLWNSFQGEKNNCEQEKKEIGIKMMNLQREVDKLSDEIGKEAKQEFSNSRITELEKEGSQVREKLNELERDLIVSEGRLEIEREKQKNLEALNEIRIETISVDSEYIKKAIEEIRSDQEKLIGRLERTERIEELQDIKEFARVIQQRLHDLKGEIEVGKKEEVKKENLPKTEIDEKPIKDLEKKIFDIRKEIPVLEEKLKKINLEISEEIRLDREKRHKFFEMERDLRNKQDELNKLKDSFNDSKIALARVEVREEDLRAEVLQEMKIKVEDLTGETGEVDRVAYEMDINRLKVQMEKIGGIDPLVVEEYEETKKRFDFLSQESGDLEKAIISLKEVIREMEQKIDASFHKTFEEINKEFTKYFRIIFGGGNAGLKEIEIKKRIGKKGEEAEQEDQELVDESEEKKEITETGIEIFACPPGKRISNLSMLSGGERSLTSLALLFSIISHNPPPFAIMDEVEAALDEANSRRFGRIIDELSSQTQFVIITHNRETMRHASLLYGITMGEDGVSKLLSVNLDQVGQGGKIMKNEAS